MDNVPPEKKDTIKYYINIEREKRTSKEDMNGNIKPCKWKHSTPTICSKYPWAQQYNFGVIHNEVRFYNDISTYW